MLFNVVRSNNLAELEASRFFLVCLIYDLLDFLFKIFLKSFIKMLISLFTQHKSAHPLFFTNEVNYDGKILGCLSVLSVLASTTVPP